MLFGSQGFILKAQVKQTHTHLSVQKSGGDKAQLSLERFFKNTFLLYMNIMQDLFPFISVR